ncbi:MAG: FG-GAP repeat protein [Planctomycetota bacterium]
MTNSPWSIAIGDLNGDGLFDLALANLFSDNVLVLLNQL